MTDTWQWLKNDKDFSWKPDYNPLDCEDANMKGVMIGHLANRDIIMYDMEWVFDDAQVFESVKDFEAPLTHKKTQGSLIGMRLNSSISNFTFHFSRKIDRVVRPDRCDCPVGLENIDFANKYELYADTGSATNPIIRMIFTLPMQALLISQDLILPFTIIEEQPDFVWLCLESSPWREKDFDPSGLTSLIARYEETLQLLESYGTEDQVTAWPPMTPGQEKGFLSRFF